jgi:microcystin-dependent protein
MKKTRWLSVVLALVLVFSLCTSAFAVDAADSAEPAEPGTRLRSDLPYPKAELLQTREDGQYKAGDTGGEDKHKLTVSELPPHSHTYDFKGADFDLSWDDDNYIYDASEHYKDRPQNANQRETNKTGGDQPHENRPPYYALCYIMRVR